MSLSTSLSRTEAWSLLALAGVSVAIVANSFHGDGEPLMVSIAFSLFAFSATYSLIRWLGPSFIKVGLKGRDMSKVKRPEIPETMGAVCAVVYLLLLIAFIPFPFYKDIVAATSGGGNRDVVQEAQHVEMGRYLHRFPHNKLASYLSGLLSLQAIVLLGIGDDLLDIRWRHKVLIPAFGAFPMLVVYFVDFGVTQVVVPMPLRSYLGETINLGWLYYAYMAAVAIFCPNSINMLAGINGVEVAQSLVIAILLLINDSLYLAPFTPYPHPAMDSHLFSIYFLLPFIGVSFALLCHNWYPSKVFVGDTYCYFAGMVFVVVGILGHFSKTLLLLFIPQMFNFLYSCPQLFHIIPCPRHRLPKFNAATGLLDNSVTEWAHPPSPLINVILKILYRLRLVGLKTNSKGEIIESTNLTLLNLWILWFGPMREDRLALHIVLLQTIVGLIALFVRHRMALLIFPADNRNFFSNPPIANGTIPDNLKTSAQVRETFVSDSLAAAAAEIEPSAKDKPAFELEDHPVDHVRDIKVGIIGAGLAGITAATLLPAKLPGINLTIYDKNGDVGGTWFENTYPGVRCDVPAHVYQSSFEANSQWTEEFAQGHEIRNYWQNLAQKHGVYKHLKSKQKVLSAEWLNEEAKWKLTIEDLNTANIYEEKLDFIVSAIGHFNAWKLPDYEGIKSFKNPLFHSSNWNHDIDLKDKRVALIGNGASGLQVLPSIQPISGHVDHYARNRTWIVDSFGPSGVRRLEPNLFSDEQLESFKNDPKTHLEYRRKIEAGYFRQFGNIFKDTPGNKGLREKWTELMLRRVGPELADKIIPDFPPNCRRPTPGPGYLEALSKPNVSFIQTRIQKFTETGIVTVDGTEREVDVVICSTGANVDFAPAFPIVANGVNLQEAWRPGGSYGYPYIYLGMAAPGFPNINWVGGPLSAGFSGTVPNSIENQVTYIAKVIRKLRSQGIASLSPSFAATRDFIDYADKFFPRTVWTGNNDSSDNSKNCSSWYNAGIPGGRVVGLFPGSAAASNYIRRDPRWEDFEYTYTNKSGNRFAWLGDGWRAREKNVADDDEGAAVKLTPHLKLPEDVDLKSHCEGWWDV